MWAEITLIENTKLACSTATVCPLLGRQWSNHNTTARIIISPSQASAGKIIISANVRLIADRN